MIKSLDNKSEQIKCIDSKTKKIYFKSGTKYLYAHNGKGFDAYIILHDEDIQKHYKFTSIIDNTTGIL